MNRLKQLELEIVNLNEQIKSKDYLILQFKNHIINLQSDNKLLQSRINYLNTQVLKTSKSLKEKVIKDEKYIEYIGDLEENVQQLRDTNTKLSQENNYLKTCVSNAHVAQSEQLNENNQDKYKSLLVQVNKQLEQTKDSLNTCNKRIEQDNEELDTLRYEVNQLEEFNEQLKYENESLIIKELKWSKTVNEIDKTNKLLNKAYKQLEKDYNKVKKELEQLKSGGGSNSQDSVQEQIRKETESLVQKYMSDIKEQLESLTPKSELENGKFSLESIMKIKDKLQSNESKPLSEEATKQWLIIPMIKALGYDPYSLDVIPEYTLDVGIKKGEKVDYALQYNDEPVIIIEYKQLNTSLNSKYIDQLFRYFTNTDAKIAILTNGDDYWFFTDSIKVNIMDVEPYYKLKLSNTSEEEIQDLKIYSKELISNINIDKIKSTNISETREKEKKTIKRKSNTKEKGKVETIDKSSDKPKKQISNIKLHHEYIFNDYSDGDWQFHKIEYTIIFGEKYEDISARKVLTTVVQQLIDKYNINPNKLAESELFKGGHKIVVGKGDEILDPYYIEEHNISVGTKLGIGNIMKFIEKLLEFARIPNEEIKLSFKE